MSGHLFKDERTESTSNNELHGANEPENDVVEGTVVRITFANAESGFQVLKVKPRLPHQWNLLTTKLRKIESDDGLINVVGKFGRVTQGEQVRIVGKILHDAKHGGQFRADVLTTVTPSTAAGIEKYLGGGVIRGVGKSTAKKIVQKFGERAIQILDHEPHRLHEIRGLSEKKAFEIAKAWRAQRVVRELMVVLASLDISRSLAERIHKRYGEKAIEVVRNEPYRLALEVWGVGFKSADTIARQAGIAPDDPQRAQAATLHAIQTLADDGHTVCEEDVLSVRTAKLLDPRLAVTANGPSVDLEPDENYVLLSRQAIGALLKARLIKKLPEGLAHTPLATQEREIASHLRRLQFPNHSSKGAQLPGVAHAVRVFETQTKIRLAPAQSKAIELAASNRVCVVTGGPGVGKTTVVRAILALFEYARLRVALSAPTGRAAKRMSEATGREAITLHRLLEVDPRRALFQRNEQNPLDYDAIVVDESSMVDIALMSSLTRAMPTGSRLVLVGDVDQLPSIGPGAVLRDVIASECIATARLNEVFRQATSSQIVAAAHTLLRGEVPEPSPRRSTGTRQAPQGEYFFIERSAPEEAAQTLVDVVVSRLNQNFMLNPLRDVQVLVPMLRGSMGTRSLNIELQARLNPNGKEIRRGLQLFRLGDRVMQTRNDYDRDVFNGDVGHVTWVGGNGPDSEADDRVLTVRLEEGRDVNYTDAQLDELTLAYACTVHKAQGSEYPAVVIGLVNQHFVMLARKLLYTALTRAKKLVVLVGTRWALKEAVRDARGDERRTALKRHIIEAFSEKTIA